MNAVTIALWQCAKSAAQNFLPKHSHGLAVHVHIRQGGRLSIKSRERFSPSYIPSVHSAFFVNA